jgi:heavy metal sensor kinase
MRPAFSWFRSLRFKLVLWTLILFGGLQCLLSAMVFYLCQSYLYAEFDQRLIDSAYSLAGAVDLAARGAPELIPGLHVWPGLGRFHLPEAFYQVSWTDGSVIERSANLGNHTLDLGEAAIEARTNGQAVLETVRDPELESAFGGANPLRIVTIYQKPLSGPACFLQIGLSEESVDRAQSALKRVLLRLLPLGLMLSGTAAWFWSRRALAPIGRISREARHLTAATLPKALPLPPGNDELTEMVTTLNDMLKRLDESFRAEERFVANAAHELRTPITHLMGQAQVLAARERTPDEYRSFLVEAQAEMRQLGSVVESLLILARADAGLEPGPVADVPINEVVLETARQCEPLAAAASVHVVPILHQCARDEEDLHVRGDADLLQVMISNLVRNAIRHSPRDGRVEIEVTRAASTASIAVRDRGPGIPPEHLPRLFERFQHPAGEPVAPRGAGLGLAIAKSIAQMHHGTIAAKNREGGGAEFVIDLPLAVS